MSWDIDFDDDDAFSNGFDSTDSFFLGGSDQMQPSSFDQTFMNNDIETEPIPTIPQQPLQQISIHNPQPNIRNQPQTDNLAEENNQLRQFFTSLKEKAARAESLNQSLKTQLEDCRNWFKNAMFSGISNHK